MSGISRAIRAAFLFLMAGTQAIWAQLPLPDASAFIVLDSNLSFEAGSALASAGKPPISAGVGASAFLFGHDFIARASAEAKTDGAYAPILADTATGSLGRLYVLLREGSLTATPGRFLLKAGRSPQYDEVDLPYSLAVNGQGLSALSAKARYEDDRFIYETRWISLTLGSNQTTPGWPAPSFSGFPDRGVNLKIYGYKFGEMRAGFQDVAVYSQRAFDLEYFLDPLPQFLVQYALGQPGRPWATGHDDNSLMGLFWDWTRPGQFKLSAQALLDDFGAFGIGGAANNAWQMAFSLGGQIERPIGTLGFNAAGATKHSFEPRQVGEFTAETLAAAQSQSAYGYTYYPDTRFDYEWRTAGFQPREIPLEQNMVGYLYGGNNLALEATWKGQFNSFVFDAALEFRLMGQNSPANAWGDLVRDPQIGTQWLDDPVLEKRFKLEFGSRWRRGAYTVYGKAVGTAAFDALELRAASPPADELNVAPADSDIWLLTPVQGNTRISLTVVLGATIQLSP